MRDQSGSGWKSGIATFLVALITFGVAWWFTRRETGAVPVWSSDLDHATARTGGNAGRPTPDESGPDDHPATGPHGADSADPLPDGSPPPGFPVKGNPNSGLYHTPESPYYGRTKAQVWFRTAKAAEAAGFQRWNARRRGK
jgi:hypothetical protein